VVEHGGLEIVFGQLELLGASRLRNGNPQFETSTKNQVMASRNMVRAMWLAGPGVAASVLF
jgi:hypothetical protein